MEGCIEDRRRLAVSVRARELGSHMAMYDDAVPEESAQLFSGVSTEPSFHLRRDETLSHGIRRVIMEQVRQAYQIEQSRPRTGRDGERSFDAAIHELRKSLKRNRAVLRLVRLHIGDQRFRQENAVLRTVGRRWGPVRDATVLADLAERAFADFQSSDTLRDHIVDVLQSRAEASTRAAQLDRQLIRRTASALSGFAARVQAWPVDGDGAIPNTWESIEPGITHAAHRVLRRRDAAAADPMPERLHDWRKAVKSLGYQVTLLKPEQSTEAGDGEGSRSRREAGASALELSDQLSLLGDLLGDDHDAAVLIRTLVDTQLAPEGLDARPLLSELAQLRLTLQAEAFTIGAQLGDAGQMANTIASAWRAERANR